MYVRNIILIIPTVVVISCKGYCGKVGMLRHWWGEGWGSKGDG